MLDDDRRDALDRRPILTIFGCHERDVPLFFLSFFFLFLHDDFIVESESMLLIGHQSPCPFAYMGNNSLIHLAKTSVYLLLLRGYIYIYIYAECLKFVDGFVIRSFSLGDIHGFIFHFHWKYVTFPNRATIFLTCMEIGNELNVNYSLEGCSVYSFLLVWELIEIYFLIFTHRQTNQIWRKEIIKRWWELEEYFQEKKKKRTNKNI